MPKKIYNLAVIAAAFFVTAVIAGGTGRYDFTAGREAAASGHFFGLGEKFSENGFWFWKRDHSASSDEMASAKLLSPSGETPSKASLRRAQSRSAAPSAQGYSRQFQSADRRQAATVQSHDLASEEVLGDDPLTDGRSKGRFERMLPAGVMEEDYCQYLNPGWGNAPYQWQFVSGFYPKGVQIDLQYGMLCGKPNMAGVWSFDLKVTDALGNFVLIHYQWIVREFKEEESEGPLAIVTDTVPAAFVGEEYFIQLAAVGGKSPRTWQISGLPPGLSFETRHGIIYGAPEDAGNFSFNAVVIDSEAAQAARHFQMVVETSALYITTTSLSVGTVGEDYYQQLLAQGGIPEYAWDVIGGVIPSGIVFDPRTGVLRGRPESAGTSRIRFQVRDDRGTADSAEIPFEVVAVPLQITTSELREGQGGAQYYDQLQAMGGTLEYQWSVNSGKLPEGIVLDPSGVLTGTPKGPFHGWITFQVMDEANPGDIDTKQLELNIVSAPVLRIVTERVDAGKVGAAYNFLFTAEGGVPPYTWSLVSGELPRGLELSPEGALSGIPLSPFEGDFGIQVVDQLSAADSREYPLTMDGEDLAIITERCDPGFSGEYYLCVLQAQGGLPLYTWTIADGDLPRGLRLSPEGVIEGFPEEIGMFAFDAQAQDSLEQISRKTLTMIIVERLEIFSDFTLPPAVEGILYETQLLARGGQIPYTWSIVSGGLPSGVFLNSQTGEIRGTSRQSGVFSMDIKVTDAMDSAAVKSFSLEVSGRPLDIVTKTFPDGEAGVSYSVFVMVDGGTPPCLWTIVAGFLPQGLSLNANTGEISGIPLQEEIQSFTVRVTDKKGQEDSQGYTIRIKPKALTIDTTSCPEGIAGNPYICELQASGGTPPYMWQILSDNLSPGLEFDSERGVVSGIPVNDGRRNISFEVTDAQSAHVSKMIEIRIEKDGLGFMALGSESKVGLSWRNPADPDFDHVEIYRSEESFFDFIPENGNMIYSGRGVNIVDSGLSSGKIYYYSLFAKIIITDGGSWYWRNSRASGIPRDVTLDGVNNPYVDVVVSFQPLSPGGYGAQNMPNVVLGAPAGGGEWKGSLEVVSLHAKQNLDGGVSGPYGGSVTLRFTNNIVVNGPGVDFTVFENAFHIMGTEKYFMEPAIVEVSADGTSFYRFPFDFVPHYDGDQLDLHHPYTYAYGFAGVKPIYSNGGDPDPTNPLVSGGDSFDLDAISPDLKWIQYVRIISTGDNWLKDINGDFVRHTHEPNTWGASGTGNSGFDLDGVCAVNY